MTIFAVTIFVGAIVDAGVTESRILSNRRTKRATSERHINYMLKPTEPSGEKAGVIREQVPGLLPQVATGAEIRGFWWTGKRCFVVAGAKFYELLANMSTVELGTLVTSTGPVDMDQGVFSLVLVDGPNGYVFALATNAFARIADPDFYGSHRVSFLDGKFQFVRPDTQQFYWSASIDNATRYDALDFASAESSSDDIVGHLVDHRELWLAGETSIEVWQPNPAADQVYSRNSGASIEVGCAARHSLQQVDNSVVWIGYDRKGQGIVWIAGGANGYTPTRISTQDIEDALANIKDLSGAFAMVHQDAGQTFYELQVPGAETTWVWDASTKKWHERAELVNGVLNRWRANAHIFAFGMHLVGDALGLIYELDPYEYTNAGDPLYREWTAPQSATPDRGRVTYESVRLDVTVGETGSAVNPMMEMCYSNNGGFTWSNWVARSTGLIGQYGKAVVWDRLGQGRDRVFKYRCSDDAKVSILGVSIKSSKGRP